MLAISQVTPTSFIQVPRLETVIPTHITRNRECRIGDQMEREIGGRCPMGGDFGWWRARHRMRREPRQAHACQYSCCTAARALRIPGA